MGGQVEPDEHSLMAIESVVRQPMSLPEKHSTAAVDGRFGCIPGGFGYLPHSVRTRAGIVDVPDFFNSPGNSETHEPGY